MNIKLSAMALIVASGFVAAAPSFAQGLTRDQVRAELAQAIRSGDIVESSESPLKLNELYPNRYPAKQVQGPALTRQQVAADLAQAIRSGELGTGGETGVTLKQLTPGNYPAQPSFAGATRAQVQAELAEALRTGDYMVGGEIDGKCYEVHPNMHTAM